MHSNVRSSLQLLSEDTLETHILFKMHCLLYVFSFFTILYLSIDINVHVHIFAEVDSVHS